MRVRAQEQNDEMERLRKLTMDELKNMEISKKAELEKWASQQTIEMQKKISEENKNAMDEILRERERSKSFYLTIQSKKYYVFL